MSKSANEIMQEVLFSSMLEAVAAMKRSAGQSSHMLLRDINSIHANSTFDDLPKALQDALKDNVRTALLAFKKEGYAIASTATPSRHTAAPKRYPTQRAVERNR